MEILLHLKKHKDGRISYGLPLWYRFLTLLILGLIGSSVAVPESSPGVVAWVVLALLGLSLLYEERWTVDPAKQSIEHRVGIYPFLRRTTIDFSSVARFSIDIFARGTVPGSEDEAAVKRKGFSVLYDKQTVDDHQNALRFFSPKKPYATLLLVTKDGNTFLVDTQPVKRAASLLSAGTVLAEACGSVLLDREEP